MIKPLLLAVFLMWEFKELAAGNAPYSKIFMFKSRKSIEMIIVFSSTMETP